MITKLIFDTLPHGEIFIQGILSNSPDGLFMTDSGGLLRWVAVKGHGNDWTIYCHTIDHPTEWVRQHGDKVFNEIHIKRCVNCDDEVFKLYRY